MPNNAPHKADGFRDGDKRKGAETRTPEEIARDQNRKTAPAGFFNGVLKLFGAR